MVTKRGIGIKEPEDIWWKLTPHACRTCGGRVLISVAGRAGSTPGGLPIVRCADCGNEEYSENPQAVCWCGLTHRGQKVAPYKCVARKQAMGNSKLMNALARSGFDLLNGRMEVGVVLREDIK